MIGLDTNVIVRLLAQDDDAQVKRVENAIEKNCSPQTPGLINAIVLAEIVWVLSRAYKYDRHEIVAAIEALLQIKEFEIQYHNETWEALHLYRDGKGGFADLYLSFINRELGCSTTLTFDKKAAKNASFEMI